MLQDSLANTERTGDHKTRNQRSPQSTSSFHLDSPFAEALLDDPLPEMLPPTKKGSAKPRAPPPTSGALHPLAEQQAQRDQRSRSRGRPQRVRLPLPRIRPSGRNAPERPVTLRCRAMRPTYSVVALHITTPGYLKGAIRVRIHSVVTSRPTAGRPTCPIRPHFALTARQTITTTLLEIPPVTLNHRP